MKENHYAEFKPSSLILRDHLAIDRTLLANERTLLAYLRSGVAMIMAGFTILHFLEQGWFWVVGLLCPPIGILTGSVGIWRYVQMHRAISLVRHQSAIKDPAVK
jgi:putative membrane protein